MKHQHYFLTLLIFLVTFSGTPLDANQPLLVSTPLIVPVIPENVLKNNESQFLLIEDQIDIIKEQRKIIQIQTKLYGKGQKLD